MGRITYALQNIHRPEYPRRSDRVVSIRTGALQKGWYPLLAVQRHAGPGSLRNRERLEPESGGTSIRLLSGGLVL